MSLAGCPGSVGVEGAGPGEGDRWGLRVWDAIFGDREVGQRVEASGICILIYRSAMF